MINSIFHKSNVPTEILPHIKKLLSEDSLTIRVIKVASIAFLIYAIVLDISYNVNRLFSQKVLPLKQKPQSTNQKALFKTAMKAIAVIGTIAATYAMGRSFFKRKIIENIISTTPVSTTSNFGWALMMAIPAAFALRRCFSSSRNTKELDVTRTRAHVEAAQDLDRIVIPKATTFNYEFTHKDVQHSFPVLAQEKIDRATKDNGSPFLVSELFGSLAVEKTEKSKIIRNLISFLLRTGFKDVREENLYVVRQNGEYKIAFFDFEEMDSNDKYTPFYGCSNPEIPGLFKIIIPEVQLKGKRGEDCLKLMDAFSEDRPNQDLASVS